MAVPLPQRFPPEAGPLLRAAKSGPHLAALLSLCENRLCFAFHNQTKIPPRGMLPFPRFAEQGRFSLQKSENKKFDAIVVGSGASGGWACKRLAEAGLKVALLEAGRP